MTPEEKQQFLKSGLLDGITKKEEFITMLKELHSAALEAMLQGEMVNHLGYSIHEQSINCNTPNGSNSKHVKTEFSESQIQIPRDREAVLNPS